MSSLHHILASLGRGEPVETADIAMDIVATAEQLTYQLYAAPKKAVDVEWGDGSTTTIPITGTTLTAYSHTYAAPGTYRLRIESTTGVIDSDSHRILFGPNASSPTDQQIEYAKMVHQVYAFKTPGSYKFYSYTFHRCSNMSGLVMPDNITKVQDYSCAYCSSMEMPELPDTVDYIYGRAFKNCDLLSWTKLPSSLTDIGTQGFIYCNNLALTSLPSTLTTINAEGFKDCPKLRITELPSGLTSLSNNLFDGCADLPLASLPANLTSIGKTVFRQCKNLPLFTIPATVTSIGTLAFARCWRTSNYTGYNGEQHTIRFKGTPTSIGSNAFDTNEKLTHIYVPWAENAVANAPWGATYAQIHYNSTP